MRPRAVARIGWSRPVAALPAAGWDDIRNPALRQKQGQNDKPDFDFTNLGMLFPQNDATEKIYISDQMPHAWVGSDGSRTILYPHIHYIQDEASSPNFTLEYRFYGNGQTVPSFSSIDTDDGEGPVFSYSSGSILQIIRFPEIELFGMTSSTWYDMILYRDDNVVSGDVLVKGFDWHAQFDALGSRGEYSK